jgi:hypothetical protein
MGMEKYIPNRAQEIHNFITERIVALQSVNNIFLENYDFASLLAKVLRSTTLLSKRNLG